MAILGYRGGTSSLRERPLREVLRAVDELDAMPEPTFEADGMEGDKGVLSVLDRGFILHAYFGGGKIRFELYGPIVPGSECDPRPLHAAVEGHSGVMSVECLKGVLRLMEEGRSPVEFVRSHALEANSVRTDD